MVQLILPPFVNNDGGPIFSIDCHPSGEKILTCGQRELSTSGVITVWNVEPMMSEKAFLNKNVPQILFQIYSQAGANCSRWSPDGKRFAVGTDDSSVTIWEFAGRVNSAGTVLGKSANIERYKECAVLKSHSMNILSVEWSQNGKFLASSSMDNHICIWNARKLPEKITTLRGHELSVKGLAWDPIGKYLASISVDKTLKLWQTDDWKCVTTISKPFESSGQGTMFSRLDWSPDGKYLFAPSATNNNAPTVQIIERQTWNIERDLVGHRKATTCVRVLPRILCTELKNGKKMQFTCVAVGSRDKGISIWLMPGISRPLFVMHRVFKHSVMDLMWNGNSLIACSQDGSIVILEFDEKIIGEALTASAMSDLCHKMYCIRPPQYENELNEIEEELNGNSTLLNESLSNSSFLTCPEDVLAQRKMKEQKEAEISIEKEKQTNEKPTNPKLAEVQQREKQMIEERSEQTEEVKNGRRRIQPIFLASTATGEAVSSMTTTTIVKKQEQIKRKEADTINENKRRRKEEDLDETSSDEDEDDEEEDDDENDEDEAEDDVEMIEIDEEDEENERRRKIRRKDNSITTEERMLAVDFRKPVLRPTELPSMKVTEGTVIMDAPERHPTILQTLTDRKLLQIEVDNTWKHGGIESSRVRLIKRKNAQKNAMEIVEDAATTMQQTAATTATKNGEQQWMAVIGATVLVSAGNKNFCIFGCGDRCLRVYRTNCGSLVTCLRLDSLPVLIGIREHAAYVLTEYGKLSTWDMENVKTIISRQPIFECVETSKEISLASLDIGENGIPLMVLSNGSVYTYDIRFSCWIQVLTSNIIERLAAPLNDSQLGDGTLGRLLKRLRRPSTVPNVSPAVSKTIRECQIEQLLNCAEVLGNGADYQSILNIYVEILCENGSEKKLKNLINELTKNGAPLLICKLRRAALYEDIVKMIQMKQPAIGARILAAGKTNQKTSLF